MSWIRALLREPLFHFGLLALLIFAFDHLLSAPSEGPQEGLIVVSAPRIEHMIDVFERTWMRQPTEAELQALIDDHVIEEIFVRDAIALGLDRDDTVIRRRLRQKMEFLDDPMVEAVTPTDSELAAFLAGHPEQFAQDPRLSFEQVFLSPDKRGDAVIADATVILESLKAGSTTKGDPSLLPESMTSADLSEVGRSFGADFAELVATSPVGEWRGPIASAFGVHLVRLTHVEPGRLPALDEVRLEVAHEWTRARAVEMAEERIAAMRERYQVQIERPGNAESALP